MKKIYLTLSILGIVLPYTQFVQWTNMYGFNISGMVRDMFANGIASGIALDALMTAVVILVFVLHEQKRLAVSYVWVPLVGLFLSGIAFALPCYLYLRESALEKKSQVTSI